MANLEEVFKQGGIPTFTFVQPLEYPRLLISLRTPGRGIVVEGPSGIGKTTAIQKALEELGIKDKVYFLSARKKADVEYIELLPTLNQEGIVVVDDFHKLNDHSKTTIADYMKTLADEESKKTKLIVIGINKAGESLVRLAHDLNNRIDVLHFESNTKEKVLEVLGKGELALNVEIDVKEEIADASHGSFYITQMLAFNVCLKAGITKTSENKQKVSVSFEGVKAEVWDALGRTFKDRCIRFCQGSKLRPEGRAPYLNLLNWLASTGDWTLSVSDMLRKAPNLKGSISQVAEKGYLKSLIEDNKDISEVLHFDETSQLLTVEDPQFVYYIRNIPWKQFSREIGYTSVEFKGRYDFALSFAGTDRAIAEQIFQQLTEREVEVFYDKNEQHRMLAADVEEYLKPIYQGEASYVICLLGPDYPKRIWTKIESDSFKDRLKDGGVIPIWFDTAPPGIFDETRKMGGYDFSPSKPVPAQIQEIVNLVCTKLIEERKNGQK